MAGCTGRPYEVCPHCGAVLEGPGQPEQTKLDWQQKMRQAIGAALLELKPSPKEVPPLTRYCQWERMLDVPDDELEGLLKTLLAEKTYLKSFGARRYFKKLTVAAKIHDVKYALDALYYTMEKAGRHPVTEEVGWLEFWKLMRDCVAKYSRTVESSYMAGYSEDGCHFVPYGYREEFDDDEHESYEHWAARKPEARKG